MSDRNEFEAKLRRSIERSGIESPYIEFLPPSPGRVLILVVSPTFEGMEESERLDLVYGPIMEDFTTREVDTIEFIYADAPSEIVEPAAAERADNT